MNWKMTAVAVFITGGLIFSGCSEDDVKDIVAGQANPVPGPTANLVVTTAPEAVLGLTNALLPVPGVLKPSAAGITAALTTLRDKNCGSGGTVDFDPDNPVDTYSATITDCVDENVVINGTATGIINTIDLVCDLPTSMSSTFNGTVVVDGETLTFTDFGVNASSITYGPNCDLVGGTMTAALTGSVTGSVSGADLGINFGDSSLNVNVTEIVDPTGLGDGVSRTVTMSIDGTITVDTPCQSGSLTITTTQPIKTLQPDVCPFEGEVLISGAFGDATVDFAVAGCNLVACTL